MSLHVIPVGYCDCVLTSEQNVERERLLARYPVGFCGDCGGQYESLHSRHSRGIDMCDRVIRRILRDHFKPRVIKTTTAFEWESSADLDAALLVQALRDDMILATRKLT